MFGGKDEANPMRCIGQESGSGFHGFKDSGFALHAKFICNCKVLCDQTYQGFRWVHVEIVGDE